jgi:hypothetical protein
VIDELQDKVRRKSIRVHRIKSIRVHRMTSMASDSAGARGDISMVARYTGNRMARRLLTLIVAIVVTAAPVAAQICEVTCTEHAGHSESQNPSHHHHSVTVSGQTHHHDHLAAVPQPASGNPTVGLQPRACGHVAAVVSESRENMRSSVATIAITTPRIAAPIDQANELHGFDSRRGPPVSIRSIAPLRI